MPTLIELPSVDANFALCRELGLRFVEVNMNLPQYQAEVFPLRECRAWACDHGLGITIHLDENLSVCDFNPLVAGAYTDTVLRAIEIAQLLSATVVTMHLSDGVYFTLPDRRVFLFEAYNDAYMTALIRFRDRCTAAIGASGLSICVENCGCFLKFQRHAIEALLKSPVFGLTYDIGHDHTAGCADEAFILSNTNKLRHMHIHDATRTQNHLILGDGEIDIEAKLDIARRRRCGCVVEAKTAEGLRRSVAYLAAAIQPQPE